ncbi:MAG: PAS domain-containing sensor histidine kinase [Comamonadaceae bacterium]|nr:PAS domain-containing sensor histidine kinase [Comamonadaceae bacterium]
MSFWRTAWGLSRSIEAAPGPFQRLWRGFLMGRLMLAAALLFLLGTERLLTGAVPSRVLWLALGYMLQTALIRWLWGRQQPQRKPALHWVLTLTVDIGVCTLLLHWHTSGFSLIPLFGLPVLMAAALGNFTVLIGTVLGVIAALAWVTLSPATSEIRPPEVLQSLLSGMGFLVLGLLVHEMASRLLGEEQENRKSREAALLQSQVNALVISHLEDGVLVVDANMVVHSANPAALEILGLPANVPLPLDLQQDPAWHPLVAMAKVTIRRGTPQVADLTLLKPGCSPVGVHARSWITQALQSRRRLDDHHVHCVVFLHDLRKAEAQVRTEKLASMGRMSAAVAHEIRNPLTAIIQANTLLAEDSQDAATQRLTEMIRQNAERLRRIAEDILDVTRVQRQTDDDARHEALALDEWSSACVRDWQAQEPAVRLVQMQLGAPKAIVAFDRDHLRRILVNLLDNALRYMGPHDDSLQVLTEQSANGQARLTVWSDGAPLEKSVEQHLFEPFFSSESRSSGLGLFLCRELCERHGATIGYQRLELDTARGIQAGNAFIVLFKRPVKSRHGQAPMLDELVI